MDIILKETEYTESLLHELDENPRLLLSRHPARDLNMISRYLCHIKNMDSEIIYQEMVRIMETHYPEFSIASWQSLLLDYAKNAVKSPMCDIEYIPVTKGELASISLIPKKPDRRVAFTLLCLAKYRNFIKDSNENWINYPYKDIFRMANVTAKITEQCRVIHDLKESGYIHMSKIVDNLSIQVCFADKYTQSPVELEIRTFKNLGYEYLSYYKEPFFRCRHCHALARKRSNNDKYCKDCQKEVIKIQKRNWDISSQSEKMSIA